VAQDYEMVGQISPELEAAVADPPGWQGEIPEPLNVEQTEHNFSFRHQRSNTQTLGRSIDNMAGHVETPMADTAVQPW
jgi:hypothetical protein